MSVRAVWAVVLVSACGDARYLPPWHDAQADAAPRAPDAADAAVAEDAATDAGPPPSSRLQRRALLGHTAVDNRLYDLALDPTSRHWVIPSDTQGTFTRLVREAHVNAPSAGPVLKVRAETRQISALATDALGAGRPLEVRVWVGRRVDIGGLLPIVSLLGTGLSGAAVAADLDPDPELQVADGIEWALYAGRWDTHAMGTVTLSIVDGEEGLDLFVTGPQLRIAPLDHPLGAPRRARARPPRAQDARAHTALEEARRSPPRTARGRPERGRPWPVRR